MARGGLFARVLDLGHRATYQLTNRFSRAGLERFVDAHLDALGARGLSILNVGADGRLAERVGRLPDTEVVQLDIDPARGPDVVGDVTAMDMFEDGRFDAVFLLEVLEHVADPARALAEVHRVLKKGGVLVLSTPFVFEIHDAPADYYRFTRHGLERLLDRFERVEIEARNGYLDTVVVLLMRLYMSPHGSDKLVALALIPWLTVSYPVIHTLGRAIKSEAATSGYVATAVK
jgi:SAM-dependent methyltransferase